MFVLLIKTVVELIRRNVVRQNGLVIARDVEPPTPERRPRHYLVLRHTFEAIQLETRLNVSKRRYKRSTLGKPMRFGFETDFPHTAYVSYWWFATLQIAKWLSLLAIGVVGTVGCAYYVFWRNGAGV